MSSMSAYFERLRGLSSSELVQQAESLVTSERRHVARLIAHLAELDARKLHLELGFSGLFDYCVKSLGLSEGSAGLRIQVAKVCREYPHLLSALAEGQVSLTVAGKLASQLTPENSERLLKDCARMTKREVTEYLVRLAPRREVSSGIRKRPVRDRHPLEGASLPDRSGETPLLEASAPAVEKPTRLPWSPPPQATIEPCRPEVYNVRFAANKALKDKLERFAEVTGIPNVNGRMAEVLEKALDIALEKTDPAERQKRRTKRAAKKHASEPRPRPDQVEPNSAPPKENPRPRQISAPVRDELLLLAGHQCEYVSVGGIRCGQRKGFAIDHIAPYARGGSSEKSNLRVLCAAHNLWFAEQCYGQAFVRRKIAAARSTPREQSRRQRAGTPQPR